MTKAPDRTPWDGIIVTDPEICFGKPRIASTRIYVDLILQRIEGGDSIEDIVADYPHVNRAQVRAALGFARDLVAAKRNRLKGEHSADLPLPPWLAEPDIPPEAIGWRMGRGEQAMIEFAKWFACLESGQAEAYRTSNPEPREWRGYYDRLAAAPRITNG